MERGEIPALQMPPSGLVASSTASNWSNTTRTSGPRSGWCTAAKTRAVMRASISCRITVLSIKRWMPISAVVRAISKAQLPSRFPGAVNNLPKASLDD